MAFFCWLLLLLSSPELLGFVGLSRPSPPPVEETEVGWWLGERSERGLLGDIVSSLCFGSGMGYWFDCFPFFLVRAA